MDTHTCKRHQYKPKPLESKKSLGKVRRSCGCLRTSDKLKDILKSFPPPPPPSPISRFSRSISAYHAQAPTTMEYKCFNNDFKNVIENKKSVNTSVTQGPCTKGKWYVLNELVHILHLSVMATALMLYYLIYCYMQFIYYTLQSALYFHNADGPMKITIAIVTGTSLVVAFNLLLKFQRAFHIS